MKVGCLLGLLALISSLGKYTWAEDTVYQLIPSSLFYSY